MKKTITLLLLQFIALSLLARTVPSFRVRVLSHRVVGGQAPSAPIVFDDENVIVDSAITLAAIPDEGSKQSVPATLTLPGAYWWNNVQWVLVDANGREQRLRANKARVVRTDSPFDRRRSDAKETSWILQAGEHARVVLDFGVLRRGDYQLRATLDGLTATPYAFSVRNGNETPAIRAAYLRYLLSRAPDPERTSELLAELSSLEPNNAEVLEDRAQLAIAMNQPADAEAALLHATRIIEENRARYEANNAPNSVVTKQFERKLSQLNALRKMLPTYFANQSTMRLDITVQQGEREYTLIRRATGEVIARALPTGSK